MATIARGEDKPITLAMSPPVNVTGWTVEFRIMRTAKDHAYPVLTIAADIVNAATGTFSAALTAEQTLGLASKGSYSLVAWRTNAGSVWRLAIEPLTIG